MYKSFKVKCIGELNTGEVIFNVGDITEIVNKDVIELEDGINMGVFETSEGFGLCDFELANYFERV